MKEEFVNMAQKLWKFYQMSRDVTYKGRVTSPLSSGRLRQACTFSAL